MYCIAVLFLIHLLEINTIELYSSVATDSEVDGH